jgi:hypothetical protein
MMMVGRATARWRAQIVESSNYITEPSTQRPPGESCDMDLNCLHRTVANYTSSASVGEGFFRSANGNEGRTDKYFRGSMNYHISFTIETPGGLALKSDPL